MRYALVENASGKIVNVVEVAEGDGSKVEDGFTLIASEVGSPGEIFGAKKMSIAKPVEK